MRKYPPIVKHSGEGRDDWMRKRPSRKCEKQELAESAEQVREKIRKRAYEFFELRGKEDGHDLDDWLKAESEVSGKG
jgi:hypothetical protein